MHMAQPHSQRCSSSILSTQSMCDSCYSSKLSGAMLRQRVAFRRPLALAPCVLSPQIFPSHIRLESALTQTSYTSTAASGTSTHGWLLERSDGTQRQQPNSYPSPRRATSAGPTRLCADVRHRPTTIARREAGVERLLVRHDACRPPAPVVYVALELPAAYGREGVRGAVARKFALGECAVHPWRDGGLYTWSGWEGDAVAR